MSLQLIIGRAGSGKTTYCHEEIEKALSQGIKQSLIMIVPEQFNLQTQEALAYRIHPGLLKVEVQSFKNLALRIFGELGGPQEPIVDDLGRLMILRKIIEENQKELILFNKSGRQTGFMECLNRLITEFEQYLITPEILDQLYDKSETSPALQRKLHDIKLIYLGFMDYIKSKFLTNEQTIDLLIEKVKESSYLKGAHIWMDGFYGFSPQQYELITELLKYAGNVTITLPLEKAPDPIEALNENNPFYEAQKAFQKLYANAKEQGVEINKVIVAEAPDLKLGLDLESDLGLDLAVQECRELCHLEKEYLKHQPKVYKDKAKDIWIDEFSNQYEEIEALAKRIIALVRDEDYRYKDIAVVAGSLAPYEGIIKGIFEEYEIPCFIDEKKSISTHALVELVKGILDVVNTNWSYNAICRVLKTGLFPIKQVDIDLLENYILAFGIRGKKMWLQEEPWAYENITRHSEDVKEYILQQQSQVNEIRNQVASYLIVVQNKLKTKNKTDRPTIREISIAIYEFLEAIKVEEQINSWIQKAKENQELSLEKEHSQIWDRVKEIFERLVDILGDEVVLTSLYAKILESAFGTVKMGMIPPARDQVIIGDIERSRIHQVRALFVIGTNDGMIPKVENGPEIFSDMDRMRIEETDIEIVASSRAKTFESQFLVYLAITKPKERLIVTCSLADEVGKSMRPSIVMHRLKKIFSQREPHGEDEFLSHIYHPVPTFGYVGRKMREQLDGRKGSEDWKDIASWYMGKENWRGKIDTAVDYLFYTNQQHYLDKETAKTMYDNPLYSSVSKLETFRQCAFCYFIKYGIKAEERRLFQFNAMDLGILFHKALEEYPVRLEKESLGWRDVNNEQIDRYVGEVVQEVVAQYGGSMGRPTAQNKYKIQQIQNMTKRAVTVLTDQIKKSKFDPKEYEVEFGEGQFPPIVINIDNNRKMLLTGTIDRVDVYELENEEFIKILDYKSGKKAFDLMEVYYGLQLQLLLYLDAYLKISTENLPAGVFYFHIDNPIIEYKVGMSKEDIEKERAKRFKLSGLVLEDVNIANALEEETKGEVIPATLIKSGDFSATSSVATNEQFNLLREHIVETIRELGKEILNGKVSALPYQLDNKQPCEYCKYLSICQFDVSQKDNAYEKLDKLKKEQIWAKLSEKKEGDDHVN
ncbi:MAG TPA: helicase-exonuclease AddAB subunit AddB [Epulopiscium sp.]|nr:helicase-exonuclease AddAB subunit AddB [Candidatus Epulonipiscium sp.]